MEPGDRGGKPRFRIDRSHHSPLGRDVDVYLPSIGEVKLDHRRIACPFGQAIVVEPAARAGGHRGHQLLVSRYGSFRTQVLECLFFPPVDLWPEQIDRAGDRKDQDKGQHEQPGIEMPSPDRAVEPRVCHHHLNRNRCG